MSPILRPQLVGKRHQVIEAFLQTVEFPDMVKYTHQRRVHFTLIYLTGFLAKNGQLWPIQDSSIRVKKNGRFI